MSEWLVQLAVPRPLQQLFTYSLSEEQRSKIQVGGWVEVSFGKKGKVHAYVVEPPRPKSEVTGLAPEMKIKPILEVGPEHEVLPPDLRELCRWSIEYYKNPPGEVWDAVFPTCWVSKGRVKKKAKELRAFNAPEITPIELTPHQLEAFHKIESFFESETSRPPRTVLLRGVTGSGKTEVYIELAKKVLAKGKSVLILVPEIALTPQLHGRFERALGTRVALWHSAVADAKRRDETEAMIQKTLRVVVGARSAVFSPLSDIGLVIVDEEHDSSYKQEERFRYHARDLALVRAKLHGANVVLGSATPSLESYEHAQSGRYGNIQLTERYGGANLPHIEIVSLCDEIRQEDVQAPFAEKTIHAIRETLAQGEQVMIFLNRRGFASFMLCADCGEVSGCTRCSISLTYHKRDLKLRCHTCGLEQPPPDVCPSCQSDRLTLMGAGTESVETELPKLIPGAKIIRLDRDQITSHTRLEAALEEFRSQKANVLLGTQMLVKGHDFPGVTLVVVVLADGLFRWPDFRATERAWQTLTQVSGRAGRAQKPGKVLIQTFRVDHPVLEVLTGKKPQEEFLREELEMRQALRYPPFGRLTRIRIENADRQMAFRHAELFVAKLKQQAPANVEFLGPSAAFVEKAADIFRFEFLIKALRVETLAPILIAIREGSKTIESRVVIDVDPQGFG